MNGIRKTRAQNAAVSSVTRGWLLHASQSLQNGLELEPLFVLARRAHRVAAGQLLDAIVVQPQCVPGLGRRDKPLPGRYASSLGIVHSSGRRSNRGVRGRSRREHGGSVAAVFPYRYAPNRM